jgi:N-acyl homoserine lactone hydrolase
MTTGKHGFSRRRILAAGVLGMTGFGAWHNWSGRVGANQISQDVARMPFVPPVSLRTASGMRVHGIQTAWVSIKTTHYALRGLEALRFASIFADTNWTEPKPVLSWILEHPEGIIVIDCGERAAARNLETYMACADAGNQVFIVNNFRLHSTPDMELGAQLRLLGLEPNDVRQVVQTHLHFDHADGFGFVPKAKVLVARAELEGHAQAPVGAVGCQYPSNLTLTAVDYNQGSFANFDQHQRLTKSGDVVLLPTPGHSYGHQSVLLRDLRRDYLFAGDVTFDAGQLQNRVIGGISHDLAKARNSLEQVRRYATEQPVVYLPSHDPESLRRFANATTFGGQQ